MTLLDDPLVQSFMGFFQSPYASLFPTVPIGQAIVQYSATQDEIWQQHLEQAETTFYANTGLPENPLDVLGDWWVNAIEWLQKYWWIIALVIIAFIMIPFMPAIFGASASIGRLLK